MLLALSRDPVRRTGRRSPKPSRPRSARGRRPRRRIVPRHGWCPRGTCARPRGHDCGRPALATPGTAGQFTPQEVQIVRIVGEGRPIARSPPSCSSAPARSTTTCATSSPSWTSRPGQNWSSWRRTG